MAVIKCKMCGGDLKVFEGESVCECEYCGSRQTVPSADNEKKMTLFTRASRLQRNCEFDKASGVFEAIVADFPEEAEAYWGLVLCKYGIEYVDDPATGKKVPTCHRSSFDNVLDDSNFEQACENADAVARRVYRDEARTIEELRKGIIEVSGKEEPYDIFISYKETDENGERTLDSVIAQDIYSELTEKGYRVFFSRISLESKLGTEYEPYIFAALNNAKVMIVVGTDYENFDAVWVKNEWSRFLKLIASGQKKTLIPVFKNMDAYDMPKEFAKLSAQDMGKVGAMQDLLHGVEKLVPIKKADSQEVARQIITQTSFQRGGPNVRALLKRGNMALENKEWDNAFDYFDQLLSMDADCAEAYLGMAMAEAESSGKEEFSKLYLSAFPSYRNNINVLRARRFDPAIEKWIAQLDKKGSDEEEKRKREAEEKRILQEELLENVRSQIRIARGILCARHERIAAVKLDGTVVIIDRNHGGDKWDASTWDTSTWRDIVAISLSPSHIVGLKRDGTVIAAGVNDSGQLNVTSWKNIKAIATGHFVTYGLKQDGTVIVTKYLDNIPSFEDRYRERSERISEWKDIIDIACDNSEILIGLKSDGTVVSEGGSYGWKDIVEIDDEGIGIQKDGHIVLTPKTSFSGDYGEWEDIVSASSSGGLHVAGLKASGTVVVDGYYSPSIWHKDKEEWKDVSSWRDVVAIAAGSQITVGLRANGTVLVACKKDDPRRRATTWKLFENYDTLEQEREDASKKASEARRQKRESLQIEIDTLQDEVSNLKGLFTGKRKREIEERIAALKKEIKPLE